MSEIERWRGVNELNYAENELAWTKQREKQLKQQLKNIRASRRKLWSIAYNCEKAARRYEKRMWKNYRIPASELPNSKWEKVDYFQQKWEEKVVAAYRIRKEIAENREKKRAAKKRLKQVKQGMER